MVAQITFVEGRQGRLTAPAVSAIVDRLRALPGIEAAAFAQGVPLTLRSGYRTGTDMRIDGRERPVRVDYCGNVVGPGYFAALGIQLLRRRDFAASDRVGALRLIGALLTMVGLYGVVAFSVGRRTFELAVRIALGASRGSVLRLMLTAGAALVIAGFALGLALAALVTRPLSAFLVADLATTDPISVASTGALLVLTSLAAIWRPAWRATRVDPTTALRSESAGRSRTISSRAESSVPSPCRYGFHARSSTGRKGASAGRFHKRFSSAYGT